MRNLTIFWHFFVLGLFSFGGPMAHIAYFRKKFVEDLNWLDEEKFSKLVALSNFLPGPSSSQVGFSIGYDKGGIVGALSAFVAFTLPSFLLLYLAAIFQSSYSSSLIIQGLISGLKLFAVIIVADATLSMFKNLCKIKISRVIFIISVIILVFFQSFYIQLLVIVLAGFISFIFIKLDENEEIKYKKISKIPLILFFVFLFIFPFFINENEYLSFFNSFYQVGSLVFGGGHVVLPLISSNVTVSQESFLTAYSLAQAVPGPMFTIASYIGAISFEQSAFLGALIATIAIFLPGFLLILAFFKSFESYSKNTKVKKILLGVKASVVAILFSVLVSIVVPSGITSILDIFIALVGFFVIRKFKLPILSIILFFCLYGIVLIYI